MTNAEKYVFTNEEVREKKIQIQLFSNKYSILKFNRGFWQGLVEKTFKSYINSIPLICLFKVYIRNEIFNIQVNKLVTQLKKSNLLLTI